MNDSTQSEHVYETWQIGRGRFISQIFVAQDFQMDSIKTQDETRKFKHSKFQLQAVQFPKSEPWRLTGMFSQWNK